MLRTKNIIAIVPARSGSKGLPHKNIKHLSGHPLLAYSIKAGLSAKHLRRVIVSTDSEEYAAIAKHYGAEVPFIRPAHLAQDLSTDLEVLTHCLDYIRDCGQEEPEAVVWLRPTSPLRRKNLIDEAIEYFYQHPDADSLRTIVPSPITPLKMWKKEGTYLTPAIEQLEIKTPYDLPRQSLPQYWFQAAAVDILKVATIRSGSTSGEKILPFEISRSEYCDIDSIEDFEKAQSLLASGKFIQP